MCGCDGNTYANPCGAAAAGVNVFGEGECNCAENADCQNGFYCKKSTGHCEDQGICTEKPTVCPELYYPVCSCNGVTYSNPCEAAAAGVNVEKPGEC